MIDDFIALSEILTGKGNLDLVLAQQYLQRIQAETTPDDFQAVMERFRLIRAKGGTSEQIIRAVGEQIVRDATLKKIAGQIIFLWYTGAIKNGANIHYGSPEQYFSGLFWEVVQAHPPMLSGGYFGYWKYPPEN